ncbi:MAG: hypothetical protein IPI67_37940 [Myxococcales bacterium]|nr:hypothetical protein [Myxococcales bacterium]
MRAAGASSAVFFEPRRVRDGWLVERFDSSGLSAPRAFESRLREFLRSAPARFASYNALCPALRDRNVVTSRAAVARRMAVESIPIQQEVFARSELAHHDQLRVVLCEREEVLGVLFTFSPRRFERGSQRMLRRLVPTLRERLAASRQLADSAAVGEALGAALEAIPGLALVVDARGVVHRANSVALLELQRDGSELRRSIVEAARFGQSESFRLTRLGSQGGPARYLVVSRPKPADAGFAVELAVRRWGVTSKQAAVLRLLARGQANKTIAATLQCAENTVEYHVTRLLTRARVESRAELMAELMVRDGG